MNRCDMCGQELGEVSYLLECVLCGVVKNICDTCKELDNASFMVCAECEEGDCQEDLTFGRVSMG